MVETMVALLALSPFIAGMVLMGKQLDVKQKSYEAARYTVWERTVWRSTGTSHTKRDEDISLEARDRVLGDPRAPITSPAELRAAGITENPLWRGRDQQRLIEHHDAGAAFAVDSSESAAPVQSGYVFVPGIAHGEGVLGRIAHALQLSSLKLNRHSFVASTVSLGLVPLWGDSDRVTQRAGGALLSDTWSARDENALRSRVDDVTTDELLGHLELPGRPLGMQAPEKGKALYGEGRFGWSPDLRPQSSTLPAAYVGRAR
jgi:hypothetical protein